MSAGRWRKLGRVFTPNSNHPMLETHAANPLAVHLSGDVFRVFYSGRDADKRSSVGAVDINVVTREIVSAPSEPVLAFGSENSFYSHGISVGCLHEVGSSRYLLYMGWHIPPGQHWRGQIGSMKIDANARLVSASENPLVGLSAEDPVSLSYPWVLRQDDGTFLMFYGSTMSWDAGNGEMLHVIKRARSNDGYAWRPDGLAVPFEIGFAQAFSRPTVVGNVREGFHMWFSYRGKPGLPYRIGYAWSADSLTWSLRAGCAGIDVSEAGWDSEMIEYPFVFDHEGARYMLYNGNDYGRTGFGLAIWAAE